MTDLVTVDTSTGEIVKFDPDKTAMKIHGYEAAERAAKAAKDVSAIEAAIRGKAQAQLEFCIGYRKQFPKGVNTGAGSDSTVGSSSDFCKRHGFTERTVQRWCERYGVGAKGEVNADKFDKEVGKHVARAVQVVEMGTSAHVAKNSGLNEWYTPAEYIKAARAVMGTIDLDPATSELANKTVKAETFYTAENDGLAHKWRGNVWMNPPYSKDLIDKFINKLVEHFDDGDVGQAIALINNATETSWFQHLSTRSSAICFPRKRIKFIDTEGNPSAAPLQGQAVLYLGNQQMEFFNSFKQFGLVVFTYA